MYRVETLDVQGNPMPTLVFEPRGDGPHPALLIAQHLPVAHAGLEKDPFTIEVGERYAAAGYVCAIPFIFHWWPADEAVEVKREAFRDDWLEADLNATYAFLQGLANVDPTRMGILGHCWGGRVAWLGACRNPALKACVVFYGGGINAPKIDGGPPPIELVRAMGCTVLGIFGNDDGRPSPADVDAYEGALKKAGVPYTFQRYDGAGHGFQDRTNPDRYCPVQSEDAWDKAIAFLAQHLKA